MPTTVVHCRRDLFDLYIGRPSRFGNPYSHKPNTLAIYRVATIAEALERYDDWLAARPGSVRDPEAGKGEEVGVLVRAQGRVSG